MQSNFVSTKEALRQRNKDIHVVMGYMSNCNKAVDTTIFKSSIMLMLYNEIEGIFSNILMELFDYIIDKDIPFDLLHKNVRGIFLEYHLKRIGNSSEKLDFFYSNRNLKNVNYVEINTYLKLYSGNLDSRQIRSISKRLGVNISSKADGKNLLRVKSYRNKLAHGEVSFQEACRDCTEVEIRQIVNEVYEYLDMIISDYDNFILRQLERQE